MDPARDLALDVLRRVFTQGAFASLALNAEHRRRPLDDKDRGLATELVYGVLRRRAELDKVISTAAERRLKDLDPKLHDVLRLGAYQLVFLERVPDHAAVDAAVEQAKARSGPGGGKKVNAILRRISDRPKDARAPIPPPPEADPAGHLALAGNLPRPTAELWIAELGFVEALRLARALLERAPLVLRANRLRTTRDALVAETSGRPGHHPDAVVLPERLGGLPQELACVREGRATVQDEASMAIVDLLAPEPGERIYDVCAAPGGKTTAIAERMGDRGEIVACDRHQDKLARVEESRVRLGLTSIAPTDPAPRPAADFDRVLLDAPCSGLGTLRRHPEIRWRFQPGDLAGLVKTQRELLLRAIQHVRPGGVLVYSVCSVLPSEGRRQLDGLAGLELEATLTTDPERPGQPDGFFAARFRRR